jgi:hypothetical protein
MKLFNRVVRNFGSVIKMERFCKMTVLRMKDRLLVSLPVGLTEMYDVDLNCYVLNETRARKMGHGYQSKGIFM